MGRALILFAKGFPYNTSEPFLENEYPLYKDYFDKVLIITGCRKNEKPTRKIKASTIEIISDYTLSKDLRSIVEALPFVLTDKMFYKELKKLLFSGSFSLKKLYAMVVMAFCGNHRAKQVLRWIKQNPEYEVDLIYSYWMNIPAYAAVRLNNKLKNRCYTVSRVHGFDLYSERTSTGYLPFQEQLYHSLSEVASISKNGRDYLEEKYGAYDKVTVHRLGALDRGCHNPRESREIFKIVSCARVIPLKRLNRIADALSKITDRQIHWTHLGGGAGLESLKKYAQEKLPENVSVSFPGTVPNTQIYDTYGETPFHAFLNVSETEGIPVSVMEAMSFDIPIIATAVGGTPELVDEGINGFLLSADFEDEQLVTAIRALMDMPESEYVAFRQEARNKFEREYNAIPNYKKFIESIADRRK
ncbi:MAG: glycosyltransferase [Clostridia bacterium]|nr:glycosyltransferase [Clostridia bacterium]